MGGRGRRRRGGGPGRSLADNLTSRIVEPLDLTSTYLAPDADRRPIGGFSQSLPGGSTAGGSYTALETAAWAAGAVASSTSDLAVFVEALADGQLLPAPLYAEMTRGLPENGSSLGIFPSDPPTPTGISNAGAIPGFTAYMQYDPATGELFVMLLNDDTRSPERLGTAIFDIVHQP